ncbi:hypothetical protein HYV43_02130 [Candidatus Micrarchaeota archaeon]|nr:hypothetical protein [Candidatus Micrarchaeota archaeon]
MRRMFIGVLLAATMIAFFLGVASNLSIRSAPSELALPTPALSDSSLTPIVTVQPPLETRIEAVTRKTVIRLPAVDKEGQGALADLTVEAVTGKGRVFIGFDTSPLVNSDTQGSLRIALDVARRLSNANTSGWDVFYTFSTQSDVVGGKSAGAAAAVATLSVLTGSRLRSDTLLTGTVEPDGSIGPVGKILEKAKAAKAAGYRKFLVPSGESSQNVVVEECQQKGVPGGIVRECSSRTEKLDVASQVPGMDVIEVRDVLEAYRLIKAG